MTGAPLFPSAGLVIFRLTCPVKFFWKKTSIADLNGERAGILYSNVNISPTLYIKKEEVNTSTSNLEKNIYRVDKKITS
jgi:hypothetical protein